MKAAQAQPASLRSASAHRESPAEIFHALGEAIEAAWARKHFDERAFIDLATTMLAEARLHERTSGDEILEWFVRAPALPSQKADDSFGEPPLLMYQGRRFFIQVLYWLDGTTSIHEHGFSGAFGVLQGSSIESTFSFDLEERVSSRVLLGRLGLKGVEYLRPGDVRPIEGALGDPHSLFHLDRPSVSVVVRTYQDPDAQPQYRYMQPGIAIDPFHSDPILDRKVQLLRVLHRSDDARYDALAASLAESGDFQLVFRVLEQAYAVYSGDDRFAALLAVARRNLGPLAEWIVPALDENRRQAHLVDLRAKYREADERFFLALLLNVPTADAMKDIIRHRHPGDDPDTLIERWLRRLSSEGEVLGLAFDDMTVAMYRHAARGASLPEILENLNGDAAAGGFTLSIARVASQYNKLMSSRVLGPLLTRSA